METFICTSRPGDREISKNDVNNVSVAEFFIEAREKNVKLSLYRNRNYPK